MQDLLDSGEAGGGGFARLRCPLRDVEEEDIRTHLPAAQAFINEAIQVHWS